MAALGLTRTVPRAHGSTHRERKELYIKALEDEVLRLKDVYSTATQERAKVAEENRRLKSLLAQYGIPPPPDVGWTPDGFDDGDNGGGPHDGHQSNMSASGSQSVFSPGNASQSTGPSASPGGFHGGYSVSGSNLRSMMQQASASNGLDYNQAGVDFVLAYDKSPPLPPPQTPRRHDGPLPSHPLLLPLPGAVSLGGRPGVTVADGTYEWLC